MSAAATVDSSTSTAENGIDHPSANHTSAIDEQKDEVDNAAPEVGTQQPSLHPEVCLSTSQTRVERERKRRAVVDHALTIVVLCSFLSSSLNVSGRLSKIR